MSIRIANAPVSFGVFGLAAGPGLGLTADRLVAGLATAGYDGIDLGPPGWLGEGAELAARLGGAGLELCGGWVDLPFHDRVGYRAGRPGLTGALDLFVAGRSADAQWWPKPTLAVSGTPERESHPCGGGRVRDIGLDEGGWRTLAANVDDAVRMCRDRGLEPTFHHHVGTHVESPDEIERLLALTGVGLTLDTGHLLMAGGDPVTALRAWAGRINHVHVKDVRLDVVADAVDSGADMHEVWRRNPFCRLGAGDLDVAGVARARREIGSAGWVVVEQDLLPTPAHTLAGTFADQEHNLRVLREAWTGGGE